MITPWDTGEDGGKSNLDQTQRIYMIDLGSRTFLWDVSSSLCVLIFFNNSPEEEEEKRTESRKDPEYLGKALVQIHLPWLFTLVPSMRLVAHWSSGQKCWVSVQRKAVLTRDRKTLQIHRTKLPSSNVVTESLSPYWPQWSQQPQGTSAFFCRENWQCEVRAPQEKRKSVSSIREINS